uniref:Putative glycosyltransferase n=1 Tax=Penicillium brasilianum TaxID=104259 RepID=A0A1E1FFN1_PENBI|nr:putative glycosyltransferase [Penicillium brasilianum]
MLAQRPSFRFLATGAIVSIVAFTFLIFGTRSSRDAAARYILKTSRPESSSQIHCAQETYTTPPNGSWEFVVERDALNHGLSDEQCQFAFPKLFGEIEKSVLLRQGTRITYRDLDSRDVEDGMVRAIIDRGQLYIVEYAPMPVTASRARATLNSLHRALTATPDRHLLPSIEFIFTTEDFANDPTGKGPVWAYSKRDADDSVWLMPDFGYWAWPEVQIGPYHEVRRRIAAIDDGEIASDGTHIPGLQFQDKKKQLVWRGSLATNPAVRSKLLKSAQSRSWASVRVIDWDDENDIRFNLLPIEDHCRYMFLAHTEGRSFSGRGKYLLNCRSVVISHPLIWREAHHAALVSSGPEANYVEVEQDFADLPRKVDFLIDNPQVAERIAENAVRTFRDRYLTPAAESCYWRHLVRQYASVLDFEPVLFATGRDGKLTPRGTPFETWLLMN